MILKFIKGKAFLGIFSVIAVLSSVVTVYLYDSKIINNVKEILPHIITLSSVILAVVSLVLTIMVSMTDKPFYKSIKDRYKKYLMQLYSNVKISAYTSIISIIINIFVMSINTEIVFSNVCFKLIVAGIDAFVFYLMIIATFYAFHNSMEILILNDNIKNNK